MNRNKICSTTEYTYDLFHGYFIVGDCCLMSVFTTSRILAAEVCSLGPSGRSALSPPHTECIWSLRKKPRVTPLCGRYRSADHQLDHLFVESLSQSNTNVKSTCLLVLVPYICISLNLTCRLNGVRIRANNGRSI